MGSDDRGGTDLARKCLVGRILPWACSPDYQSRLQSGGKWGPGYAGAEGLVNETLTLAPALEIVDLRISCGRGGHRRELISGISVAIAEGEIFGIVGDTGAGKTTILKAVAGLHPGWSGAIRMRQHELEVRRPKRQQKM